MTGTGKKRGAWSAEAEIRREWSTDAFKRRGGHMDVLLNAGFGHALRLEQLLEIKALGFSGVRQDILSPADAGELVSETIVAKMPSLFICRSVAAAQATAKAIRLWPSQGIEIGNEEDSKQTPRAYYRQLIEMSTAIRLVNRDVQIWTAGLTAHDEKRLAWLEDVYTLGVPSDIGCCVHGYAQKLPPGVPRPGFKSRAAEYAKIRSIIGPERKLAQSEIGYHTAPFRVKTGWFTSTTRQWTNEQVASFLQGELTIAKANGLLFSTIFQLNDGPDPLNHEHNFGLRGLNGAWKPQAAAVSQWVRANA
jgi:hypothetical protein